MLRTHVLRMIVAVGLAAWGVAAQVETTQIFIEHADTVVLPDAANDQHGTAFTITGLSGVTWLGGESYVAVMDNSDKVVFFELALAEDGTAVSLSGVRGLTLSGSGDHEGIAVTDSGTVLISHEGSMRVREFALDDGALLGTWSTPGVYASRRNNLGLESLSFDPVVVWTANEEALTVDGERASPDAGTVVRLLRMRTTNGVPLGQYAYEVEPMHGPRIPFGNPGQSGLSDLVALPDGSLLALERSLALTTPLFLTRIYRVGFIGASDVSGMDGLVDATYEPVAKTLLYSGGHNNLEGLCLGPRLRAGVFALVGVVDDGDPVSTNAVEVFRLTGLRVCASDVDGDGAVDIDDLYRWHTTPTDLNGDGVADEEDRRCLETYLRRYEGLDAGTRD